MKNGHDYFTIFWSQLDQISNESHICDIYMTSENYVCGLHDPSLLIDFNMVYLFRTHRPNLTVMDIK